MEEETLNFLRHSPLFAGFTENQFQTLLPLAQTQEYEAGDEIVKEGEPGDRFFILIEGTLDIVKESEDGDSHVLASLDREGDFFGEMSVVDIQPRSATVKAREKSRVIVFTNVALVDLFDSYPEVLGVVALNIARVLSLRLRTVDEALAALSG
jgi:CRP-like cAMP-binding protein